MAPSESDIVVIAEETLATAGAAELSRLVTGLGLPLNEAVDVEALRLRLRRCARSD